MTNIELKNFIELSDKDRLMVLDWRNTISVRKMMYHSDIISKKEHFYFLNSLENCDDKLYFLVIENNSNIGAIYFIDIDRKNKVAEFGLYANPALKGKGKVLMEPICKYGFDKLNLRKIIAEVFTANQKAIDLYRDFNFNKVSEKVVYGNNVFIMELKNENRQF